jgi:hypothetical protein
MLSIFKNTVSGSLNRPRAATMLPLLVCQTPNVHRDLDEGIRRVPVGQVAPDKHHGRARRCGKDDAASDVLIGVRRGDKTREDYTKEQKRRSMVC